MSNTTPTPQFGTAEYEANKCKFCGQAVAGPSYNVNGSTACASCAERAKHETPGEGDGAFARALFLGVIGAAIGLAIYAGFTIITNIEIGYVSLAVGFIVAKAMMIGSGGVGGRKYQVAAALLTYAAVSLAFIPILLYAAHVSLSDVSLAKLLELGLASPFMELKADPVRGLIGLVILFVGINIAWKMTAGKPHSVVQGPS
ncbi:MAG TPA: hypothetical protein VKY85_10865 [Candidatus Angelobacter sp.]|nr:hypothetical protein [Candidatus Angelobacter sp.]